jgi:hypothetical protein
LASVFFSYDSALLKNLTFFLRLLPEEKDYSNLIFFDLNLVNFLNSSDDISTLVSSYVLTNFELLLNFKESLSYRIVFGWDAESSLAEFLCFFEYFFCYFQLGMSPYYFGMEKQFISFLN